MYVFLLAISAENRQYLFKFYVEKQTCIKNTQRLLTYKKTIKLNFVHEKTYHVTVLKYSRFTQ